MGILTGHSGKQAQELCCMAGVYIHTSKFLETSPRDFSADNHLAPCDICPLPLLQIFIPANGSLNCHIARSQMHMRQLILWQNNLAMSETYINSLQGAENTVAKKTS